MTKKFNTFEEWASAPTKLASCPTRCRARST